jgi:predicted MPP superfamily phosphohydrolase
MPQAIAVGKSGLKPMTTAYEDGTANTHPAQEIARARVRLSQPAEAAPNRKTGSQAKPAPTSLRGRILGFVGVVQTILFLGHWFIYQTWAAFAAPSESRMNAYVGATLAALSISFVGATLLAHRFNNRPVRILYRFAAVWLGFLNFFFLAAGVIWVVHGAARLFGLFVNWPILSALIFASAVFAALTGLVNARWIRVKRITVKLASLPPAWRGRVAALVSDVHLGHVNGLGFMRRIVSMLRLLKPDVVFITGDLFDGTRVNPSALAAPWKSLAPRFGSYFVTGNHEEFTDPRNYLEGVRKAGVRVLHNEKVVIDGLQVVGVHFSSTTHPDRFSSVLETAKIDKAQASILLSHAPHALEVAGQAGISLQLSGHTHRGQIFPYTWFTKHIFGAYTYGLQTFRTLAVYTTSGVGTWGPPLRLGTNPEIVLLRFE